MMEWKLLRAALEAGEKEELRQLLIEGALSGINSNRLLKTISERAARLDLGGKPEPFCCTPDEKKRQRWRHLEERGYWTLTILDDVYPELLLEIDAPPAVLFGVGEKKTLSLFSIAVIGVRKASDYGLRVGKLLTEQLSREGICIVSGLARGIDQAAHRACLAQKGRTVAVLGSGIDRIYPPEHRGLALDIAQNGALISEFPPGVPPLAHHFIQRNRLLSGLSRGILVVEAMRRSGTMITTRFAAEQGRDVFAVPGNIDQPRSEGTNALIQSGAKLVCGVDDMRCEYADWPKKRELTPESKMSLAELRVYDTLSQEPADFDKLRTLLSMDYGTLWQALTHLELAGRICCTDLGIYVAHRQA